MNLNPVEKKLYSRVAIILGIIVILGVIYFGLSRVSQFYENRGIEKNKILIEKYEARVDSFNVVNKILILDIKSLNLEIDSLHKIKHQIIINNEKKVNAVYSASISDNAKWLDSIISKVDSL